MTKTVVQRASFALALALLFGACGSLEVSTGPPAPPQFDLASVTREKIECVDFWVTGAEIDLLFATAPTDAPKEVYHTRSKDGGATWSESVRVDKGQEAVTSTHMWIGPQIAANGDQLVAVWTVAGTGFMGRGPLVSMFSGDGGATWTAGPAPAPQPERGGQAFPDLAVDADGSFHLVWLGKLGGSKDKSLLFSSSHDAGASWTGTEVIDPASCECCWNRLIVGEDNSLFTIYRNRDPRDMSVAALTTGTEEWRDLGHVGAFDWDFDGCPHVGAGIQPIGRGATRSLHAVVWTGEASAAGTYYVRSTNNGKTWGFPNRIGTPTSIHCDISGVENGPLLRVWDNWDERGKFVFGSVSHDNGKSWSEEDILSGLEASSDYPAIVRLPAGFRVFWFEKTETGKHLNSRYLSDQELTDA